MVKRSSNSHEFALYFSDLSRKKLNIDSDIVVEDKVLLHRILRVLRLQLEDRLVIFDEQKHALMRLVALQKKQIVFRVESILDNVVCKPYISVWLPLLKKDAFEHAIYSAVELGVNEVRLVHVEKEQRHWHGQKEMERLKHIMIAAAEQSKNFAMPHIYEPVPLHSLLGNGEQVCIFYDMHGQPFGDAFQMIKQKQLERYAVLIGPEGDLTEHEKFQLLENDFIFAHLTPTVLRAQQAFTVGVGMLRSLLS